MSKSSRRDLGFSLAVGAVVAIPIFYFDVKHYDTTILDHLPDHILAVLAIVGAALAIRYERKLDKAFEAQRLALTGSFEDQKTRIEKIVLAIYTRFLGVWPAHLKDITRLVMEATAGDELQISLDMFGYGHFTAPEEYKRYFLALDAARRSGVAIKVMVHPEDAARKCLHSQLDEPKNSFARLRERLPAYQKEYPQLVETLPSTYEEFLTLALYVQSSLCLQLAGSVTDTLVEVKTAADPPLESAVFSWTICREGKASRMIFAYPRYLGVGKGYGFETHDMQLMEIFSDQFQTNWEKAAKIARAQHVYPEAAAEIQRRKQGAAVAAGAAIDFKQSR